MNEKDDDARPMRLITTAEFAARLGTRPSHVNNLQRTDPTFPKPVKLGAAFNASKRFVEREAEAYIAARIAARDSEGARNSSRGSELAAQSISARR